jgi:EAL domain-containing protein (putative c-di-GMP-specific phosphodiesterase class I)
LRRALDLGELRLVYQPKLDLATHRLVGVEALLRWHNKSLGNVAPDRFVPYAESTGDIVRIGEWVLKRALADLRLWRLSGLDLECVSVNVSYRQLINEGFERVVEEALRENALEPDSLELEFTERVLIDDAPETMNTLAHLRRMGVTLTIDDFGEGYSALGYLRRLPVQGLKLSHTFMRGVPNQATDTHLCQAIIALARNLDLSVTIEGVERHDQLAFVRQHGAQFGQGFLFAAPMEATALLTRYGPR